MLRAHPAATHRSLLRVCLVVTCCAVVAAVAPAGTFALFSGTRAHAPTLLHGAEFSPAVAPIVSHVRVRNETTLSWSAVTISSGTTVLYRVMRIPGGGGSPVQVCTGASAPVTTGGSVSCTETIVGAKPTDTYTEQPYVAHLGQMTWSIAPSIPA